MAGLGNPGRRSGRGQSVVRSVIGDETGLAAVEFALLAPVLLAIVFGIIVYGLTFTVAIAVNEAAAAGARASVAGLSTAERESDAQSDVTSFLSSYGPLIKLSQATITTGPTADGDAFQVSVSYDISSLGLSVFGPLLPVPSSTLSATVTVSTGGL